MFFPSTVVDNFYNDPENILSFINELDFKKSTDGSWPGERTEPLEKIEPDFSAEFHRKYLSTFFDGEVTQLEWEITSYFQKIYPNADDETNSGWIHQDDSVMLAGVIYLNKNAPLESGTSIFKIKDKSKEEELRNIQSKYKKPFYRGEIVDLGEYKKNLKLHNESFEETLRVNNVFNRLITYEGHLPHKQNGFAGFKDEPRLTHVFFVKRITSNRPAPLQRTQSFINL